MQVSTDTIWYKRHSAIMSCETNLHPDWFEMRGVCRACGWISSWAEVPPPAEILGHVAQAHPRLLPAVFLEITTLPGSVEAWDRILRANTTLLSLDTLRATVSSLVEAEHVFGRVAYWQEDLKRLKHLTGWQLSALEDARDPKKN